MMMKIFGAVLIVSGGYLLGKVRSRQLADRQQVLRRIELYFKKFDAELREYRRSLHEFSDHNVELLKITKHKLLLTEERFEIEEAIKKIEVSSFRESMEVSSELLRYLASQINKVEEDVATTGKALPIVTGAIGLLVAVLLF